MTQIALDHVDKVYRGGLKALDDLNLAVADGEFMVLLGPSGCGKSTALRSIAGLEEINGGTISIGQRVANHLPPRERDIAMVSPGQALYPRMTVEQNLAFGLRLRGAPRAEIARRVARAARILGLEPYLSRHPATLSAGQRQRVAMGRAIVREPRAFLMDEPLSNLDAGLRASMRAVLGQMRERLGVTTVYVTHDQAEAMTLGDRVCVMLDGRTQQADTPQRLFESPANLFVAGYIGFPAMNFAEARLVRDGGPTVTFAGHALPVPAAVLESRPGLADYLGRTVIIGIRPSHFDDAAHGERVVGAVPGHGHRDRRTRHRDPRDLPGRRPADRSLVVRRRRRAQRRGGRGRLRPGGREVAVDRAGLGSLRAPPRPAARARRGHRQAALLRPRHGRVDRAPERAARVRRLPVILVILDPVTASWRPSW